MTTAPKEIRLENIQNSVTTRPNITRFHHWRLVLRTSEVKEMSKNPYLLLRFFIRPFIYLLLNIAKSFETGLATFDVKNILGNDVEIVYTEATE